MINSVTRGSLLTGLFILVACAALAGGLTIAAAKIDAMALPFAIMFALVSVVGTFVATDATTGHWIDQKKLEARLTSLAAAADRLIAETGVDSDPEIAACRARLLAEIAVFRSETEVKK